MQKPTAATSKRMAATRARDNPRELSIRSLLHRMGFRYRVHQRIIPGSSRTADIVFVSARVAVFLDGCFWHGCAEHGTLPKTNTAWWQEKIVANRTRDLDTIEKLKALDWVALRIWDHVPMEDAAFLIVNALRLRGQRSSR